MNARRKTSRNTGIALLVVLIIVMAITITAMGFLSQSDVELACGTNMLMRTQMDYLAESGLDHAKGLILNPQDVAADYWDQPRVFQLVPGSSDYYDVKVIRDANDSTNYCNYNIGCNSYRMEGTDKIGLSRLHAVLRLDPCIAYWVGGDTTIPSQVAITGDVYCGGILTNSSNNIRGDAFAVGTISGTVTGRKNQSVASPPVAWPGLAVADFAPPYHIIDGNVPSMTEVGYSTDDANMLGNVTVNGTLVITGKLTISGSNNVITAGKNFPALVVGGQVLMKEGSSLVINGLAQINGPITFDSGVTNATLQVTGGLFINSGGIEGVPSNATVVIIAAPAIASIEIWPDGTSKRWRPAAGAFFKSIERIK
jgi:hypothetical protein